jgi:hypothetical protein
MPRGCGGGCERGYMLVAINVLGLLTQGLTCHLIDQAAPRFLHSLDPGPAHGPP